MTIQEAVKDLQDGEDGRVAECLDTQKIVHGSHILQHVEWLDYKSVMSNRWITRDSR